jgi:hypothetical protein
MSGRMFKCCGVAVVQGRISPSCLPGPLSGTIRALTSLRSLPASRRVKRLKRK